MVYRTPSKETHEAQYLSWTFNTCINNSTLQNYIGVNKLQGVSTCLGIMNKNSDGFFWLKHIIVTNNEKTKIFVALNLKGNSIVELRDLILSLFSFAGKVFKIRFARCLPCDGTP